MNKLKLCVSALLGSLLVVPTLASCDIPGEQEVTSDIVKISISGTKEVVVGGTTKLTANVTVKNGASKAVTWYSSNNDVATVASDGTVTGIKVGSASITATSIVDPTKKAIVSVVVKENGSGGGGSDVDSSFAEALAACKALGNGATSTNKYVVDAVISSNPSQGKSGNYMFSVSDPSGSVSDTMTCYYLVESNGKTPKKGDEISINAYVQNFVNDQGKHTYEFVNGTYIISDESGGGGGGSQEESKWEDEISEIFEYYFGEVPPYFELPSGFEWYEYAYYYYGCITAENESGDDSTPIFNSFKANTNYTRSTELEEEYGEGYDKFYAFTADSVLNENNYFEVDIYYDSENDYTGVDVYLIVADVEATFAEALADCKALGNGEKSDILYYVEAVVSSNPKTESDGSFTFEISDPKGKVQETMQCYKLEEYNDGTPKIGDQIIVYAYLQNFVKNNEHTYEFVDGLFMIDDSGSETGDPIVEAVISDIAEVLNLEYEYDSEYECYSIYLYPEGATEDDLEQVIIDLVDDIDDVVEYDDDYGVQYYTYFSISGYEAYFYNEDGSVEVNAYSYFDDDEVYVIINAYLYEDEGGSGELEELDTAEEVIKAIAYAFFESSIEDIDYYYDTDWDCYSTGVLFTGATKADQSEVIEYAISFVEDFLYLDGEIYGDDEEGYMAYLYNYNDSIMVSAYTSVDDEGVAVGFDVYESAI